MLDFSEVFLASGDKVICFGDSITEAGGYVVELQKRCPQYTFVNGGRSGDKTPWALTRFVNAVLDQKPDALLIYLGANDAAIGRSIWGDEPMVTPETYRCNLVWMAYLARQAGIQKISFATPLQCFEGEHYLRHGDILRSYCLQAREAADIAKARLVPLDAMSERVRNGAPATEYILTRDGTHPTEEGHRLIAQEIIDAWKLPTE